VPEHQAAIALFLDLGQDFYPRLVAFWVRLQQPQKQQTPGLALQLEVL
jgi:hypothetical protein